VADIPDQKPLDERRKYVRLSSQNLLRCEVYRIPEGDAPAKKEAMSKNISAGGVLFESAVKYDIGEVLKLEIKLTGWSKYKPEFYKPDALSASEPLVALGNVVRIEALENGMYDVGLCLSGIDEGHQMAVEKFIAERLKEIARRDTNNGPLGSKKK
jgi:c-di-GMP-binding flagellar brake protein YcgR